MHAIVRIEMDAFNIFTIFRWKRAPHLQPKARLGQLEGTTLKHQAPQRG
jgi:hypothetical protein